MRQNTIYPTRFGPLPPSWRLQQHQDMEKLLGKHQGHHQVGVAGIDQSDLEGHLEQVVLGWRHLSGQSTKHTENALVDWKVTSNLGSGFLNMKRKPFEFRITIPSSESLIMGSLRGFPSASAMLSCNSSIDKGLPST